MKNLIKDWKAKLALLRNGPINYAKLMFRDPAI